MVIEMKAISDKRGHYDYNDSLYKHHSGRGFYQDIDLFYRLKSSKTKSNKYLR